MPLEPMTVTVNRALNRLIGTSRGELCKLACDLAEVPWIKEAFFHAPDRDIRCLGRFDITGPDRKTPWPSVLIEVRRRPQHNGQTDRKALVAVYLNEKGEWEVAERENDKIPWEQYRGDREGSPSVLNGDRPHEAPEPVTPQPG